MSEHNPELDKTAEPCPDCGLRGAHWDGCPRGEPMRGSEACPECGLPPGEHYIGCPNAEPTSWREIKKYLDKATDRARMGGYIWGFFVGNAAILFFAPNTAWWGLGGFMYFLVAIVGGVLLEILDRE